MPLSVLTSQFDTLEPLASDERGVTLDESLSVEAIVAESISPE